MANDTHMTLVGNLADDPTLRFTPSGDAVANFRIGSTPSKFDRDRNEWVDTETIWMDCVIWKGKAEAVAESFKKGSRVIVTGRVKTSSWEASDGSGRRSKLELDVVDAGLAVRSPNTGGGQRPQQQAQQTQANPWATASKSADEPPF